ncbi:MAG: hypothetical protein WA708_09855 [Acidobacteriaceae bacterium]
MKMWLDSLSGPETSDHALLSSISRPDQGTQFGDMPIDSVKALMLKNWLDSLAVSPSYRAHHRTVFPGDVSICEVGRADRTRKSM